MALIRTRDFFPKTSFLNDFFNSDWPSLDWRTEDGARWVPANVREDEKEFTVELSLPGYTRKDIHVEVDSNNVLHISGERKEETKEEKGKYSRREFTYGSFERSFQLPEAVDEEKISAKCKDGVLTVELPKKETALLKKKVKEIQIS